MQNKVNYNFIAPIYDQLNHLVFGQKTKEAQIVLLPYIPANSSVLIVGGGTGWILEEIKKNQAAGLSITYIDMSSKMIELSKKRDCGFNRINFIQAEIENTSLGHQRYDAVLTPFFLDNFSQTTFEQIFIKLNDSLNPNGLWLYSDFQLTQKNKWWQKSMLQLMYSFFRLTCRIEATKLPDVAIFFSQYTLVKAQNFYHDFICARVYKKRD